MTDTFQRREAHKSHWTTWRSRLVLLMLCLALIGAGLLTAPAPGQFGLLIAAGVGLIAVAAAVFARSQLSDNNDWIPVVRRTVLSDPWPSVLTDETGQVTVANDSSQTAFGAANGRYLGDVLASELVAAEPLVERLLRQVAESNDPAQESMQVDRHELTVSAHRLSSKAVLWRFRRTELAPGHFDDGLPLPVILGSRRSGWEALNSSAADRLVTAELSRDNRPPKLSGFSANRLLHSGDLEAHLYVPNTLATVADLTGADIHETSTLDALIEALPVPILRIATAGEIEAANAPARKLLGMDLAPYPPLYQIVEGMGRSVSDWLADAVASRGLLKPEFVRASLPDKDVYLQIVIGRIENEGGTHLIGILNDATELKSLEAQFVQSQKMQAIGQLAGGVAHDFNNLLTAISGHCDLLLLRHDQSDPDYADLKQIGHNANRAASLVGQLLAFSRKQTLKAQPLDLHETITDLTHLLNRLVGERVRLSLDISPLDKVIRADRRGFEQVIMNLVVNARDAMPNGGPVDISVDAMVLEDELVRDRAQIPAGDYIVVCVRDKGHGIDPERLPKIFEPFYTTKKTGEGTGLGLSTAYGIMKQSGGFIFAESEVGKGTCFTLIFPAHSREAAISHDLPKQRRVSDPAPQNGVVLLVEDEAPVRAFASRALRLRGHTVLEAEDAESALEILQDATLQVDVFVTDVIMPGLDGPSWVRQALEDRPETRVVFVSGYSEENLSENQSRVPNSVFLAKPFSLTQLTDVVQKQMS